MGDGLTLADVFSTITVKSTLSMANPWLTQGSTTLVVGAPGSCVRNEGNLTLQSNLADQGHALTIQGEGTLRFDDGETLDLRHHFDTTSATTPALGMMANTVIKSDGDWRSVWTTLQNGTAPLIVEMEDPTTLSEGQRQVYWAWGMDLSHLWLQTRTQQNLSDTLVNSLAGWRVRGADSTVSGSVTKPIEVLAGGVLTLTNGTTLSNLSLLGGGVKLAPAGTITTLNVKTTGSTLWLPSDTTTTINTISFDEAVKSLRLVSEGGSLSTLQAFAKQFEYAAAAVNPNGDPNQRFNFIVETHQELDNFGLDFTEQSRLTSLARWTWIVGNNASVVNDSEQTADSPTTSLLPAKIRVNPGVSLTLRNPYTPWQEAQGGGGNEPGGPHMSKYV